METISEIIKAYRIAVIENIFMGLLVIKLFSKFFTQDAYVFSKEIIRWLIIACAAVSLLNWFLYMGTNIPALPERATGKYAAVFWMLIFFSDILPFVLLFNKLKHSTWAILLVVLLMNFAVGMEWLTTSASSGSGTSIGFSFTPLLMLLLRGTLLAIFITAVSLVVNKYRKTNANDINAL
jgi:hypothetical protein